MTPVSTPGLRSQHALIRRLADAIESVWQNHLELSPYAIPAELGYVEGKLEGEKLTIENNLDILHCVMFPRVAYALPMFGCDLVGGRGQISAAIADLSPLNRERTLSPAYTAALSALPNPNFSQPRELPVWGDIFSPFCTFIRPGSPEEEEEFLAMVRRFLEIHCTQAIASQPVSAAQQAEIFAAQQYYCTKQQQNDKTRRVLEKAFGAEWAEHYMTTILFDLPPIN
jgi:phycocyanobilin:ferredoxin oxidoreductase